MPRPRSVPDEAILDAAARVLGRRGPVALTLAEVGRECGLAAPTLLQRFGTKRALLEATVARGEEALAARFAAARAARSPAEALVEALADEAAGFRTPEEVAHGLAFLQVDLSDARFRAIAASYFARRRALARAAIRAAMAQGELHVPDPAALARLASDVVDGALVAWGVRAEGSAREAVRRDLDALLAPYRATRRRRRA